MSQYVTKAEYLSLGYTSIPDDDIDKYLKQASQVVDTLTFGRTNKFWDELTEFQVSTVKDVVCELADFYFENADYIESIFDSYSINSVSMHIGAGMGVDLYDGVPAPRMVYSLLEQTGLCCRLAR